MTKVPARSGVTFSLSLALSIVLGCSVAAAGQSAKPPKNSKTKASALSAAYSQAALAALKAIEMDDTVPHIDNGKPVGDKTTLAAIDAAGAKAQKAPEKSTTEALNAIYNDKLLDNDRRNAKKMDFESDSGLEDEGSREMTAIQRMQSDTELISMDEKEKSCFDTMEAMLKTRSSSIPAACLAWSPSLKALPASK
jgi:uncharacterized protein (DUF885 family)